MIFMTPSTSCLIVTLALYIGNYNSLPYLKRSFLSTYADQITPPTSSIVTQYGTASGSSAGINGSGGFNVPPIVPNTSVSNSNTFGTINNGSISTSAGTSSNTSGLNTSGFAGSTGGNYNTGGIIATNSGNTASYGIVSSHGTTLGNGIGVGGSVASGVNFVTNPTTGETSTSSTFSMFQGAVSPQQVLATSQNNALASGNSVVSSNSGFNVVQPNTQMNTVQPPTINAVTVTPSTPNYSAITVQPPNIPNAPITPSYH